MNRNRVALGVFWALAFGAYFLALGLSSSQPSDSTVSSPGIFYLSPAGDDANDGLSPDSPWRTIARANRAQLEPGLQIRLQGGQTFQGSLLVAAGECGTGDRPIVISTYGNGRATIEAGVEAGIIIEDCGGYEISDLKIVGAGGNSESGIQFRTDLGDDVKLEHVVIDNVEISGFRFGIDFMSTQNTTGYKNVRIVNSKVHDNIRDGIRTSGKFKRSKVGWSHEDFYIAHNEIYNNFGDPDFLKKHSGSGIVLSDIDGALVEHNEAHNNGGRNRNTGGGPVGIWAWECNNVVFQFNESHHNHRGANEHSDDGDGFDLDGGCGNSMMQYNYSHDNDGAGFLVWQFGDARPKENVTVRYNISVNDAREKGYGAITIGGAAMSGVYVYNNTIFRASSPTGNGLESGIAFWNTFFDWSLPVNQVDNIRVFNNLFVSAGDDLLIRLVGIGKGLLFAGNHYDTDDGRFLVEMAGGRRFESLEEWRTATGQERLGEVEVGSIGPSLLSKPGGAKYDDYRLRAESLLRDRGLDLTSRLAIEPGTRDFFGNAIPQSGAYDIGAHEFSEADSTEPAIRPQTNAP